MKRVIYTGLLVVLGFVLGGCAHHHHGSHSGQSVYTGCGTGGQTKCASQTVTVLPPVYQVVPANPCQSPCGRTLPPTYQPVMQSPCAPQCNYAQPAPCGSQCGYPRQNTHSCNVPNCGSPQHYSYPQQSYPQQPVMPPAQPNPTGMVYPIDMSKKHAPGSTGVQTYLYQPAGGVVYQY